MKKTITLAAMFTVIFLFGGCVNQEKATGTDIPEKQPEQAEPLVSEKSCQKDADCACGRRAGTRECFVGNAKYVDPNLKPCPDFCSGIDGRMKLKCAERECKLSRE